MYRPFLLENLIAKTTKRRKRRRLRSALPLVRLIHFHFPVQPITFHIYRKVLLEKGKLPYLFLFLNVLLLMSLRRMTKKSNFPNWLNHLSFVSGCFLWPLLAIAQTLEPLLHLNRLIYIQITTGCKTPKFYYQKLYKSNVSYYSLFHEFYIK